MMSVQVVPRTGIGIVMRALLVCLGCAIFALSSKGATQYMAVDLYDSGTPINIPMGAFLDASGPGQVGTIGTSPPRAVLWRSSPASIVDLTPAGADASRVAGAY